MVLPHTYVIIDIVVPMLGTHLWVVISMTALASVHSMNEAGLLAITSGVCRLQS